MSMGRWLVAGAALLGIALAANDRDTRAASPVAANAGTSESGRRVKQVEVEMIVHAAPKDVWAAWTTAEGIGTFFAPSANIELRPGGAYEILFMPGAPKGSRGAEDCQVIWARPMEMLAFTWSAPPQWPDLRKERTVVIVQLQPVGDADTRVNLTHLGFGEGKGWDEVHRYFGEAWNVVLGRLKDRFVKGPIDWSAASGARPAGSEKSDRGDR